MQHLFYPLSDIFTFICVCACALCYSEKAKTARDPANSALTETDVTSHPALTQQTEPSNTDLPKLHLAAGVTVDTIVNEHTKVNEHTVSAVSAEVLAQQGASISANEQGMGGIEHS